MKSDKSSIELIEKLEEIGFSGYDNHIRDMGIVLMAKKIANNVDLKISFLVDLPFGPEADIIFTKRIDEKSKLSMEYFSMRIRGIDKILRHINTMSSDFGKIMDFVCHSESGISSNNHIEIRGRCVRKVPDYLGEEVYKATVYDFSGGNHTIFFVVKNEEIVSIWR